MNGFCYHTPRLRFELRSKAPEALRISATLSGQYVKKRMRRLFYFARFLNKKRLFFFKQPPSNSVPTETRTQVESSAGFQDIHYPIRTRRRTKWHIYHINLILKSRGKPQKKIEERMKKERVKEGRMKNISSFIRMNFFGICRIGIHFDKHFVCGNHDNFAENVYRNRKYESEYAEKL